MNKILLSIFYLLVNIFYFSIFANNGNVFKEIKNSGFRCEDEKIKNYCINLIITIVDSIVKNDLSLSEKEIIKNTILKDSVLMDNLVKFMNKKIKLQKEINYKNYKLKYNKFYKTSALLSFALIFSFDEFYRNIIATKYSFKYKNMEYLSYLKIISGIILSFFSLKDLINENDYKKIILQVNSKEEIEEENAINNQIIEKIIYEGESIILQKNKNKNNYL